MTKRLPTALWGALLLLAAALTSLPAGAQMPESETVRIWYLPFDSQTSGAIREANIEAASEDRVAVHVNDPAVWKLKAILETAKPGLVDLYKLRAKITLPFGEEIHIDRFGGVRSNYKGNAKLSEAGRSELENLIKKIIKSGN